MSRKTTVVSALMDYFEIHGRLMNRLEYQKSGKGPYSAQAVIRSCGSWNRAIAILKRVYPERVASLGVRTTAPRITSSATLEATETPAFETPKTAADALKELAGE